MLDICLQSNTDHARLFIERVVAYAGCDIASEQFRSDVIDRLKKAAKVCTANASGMLAGWYGFRFFTDLLLAKVGIILCVLLFIYCICIFGQCLG